MADRSRRIGFGTVIVLDCSGTNGFGFVSRASVLAQAFADMQILPFPSTLLLQLINARDLRTDETEYHLVHVLVSCFIGSPYLVGESGYRDL